MESCLKGGLELFDERTASYGRLNPVVVLGWAFLVEKSTLPV
jgi:hypothetical protein